MLQLNLVLKDHIFEKYIRILYEGIPVKSYQLNHTELTLNKLQKKLFPILVNISQGKHTALDQNYNSSPILTLLYITFRFFKFPGDVLL